MSYIGGESDSTDSDDGFDEIDSISKRKSVSAKQNLEEVICKHIYIIYILHSQYFTTSSSKSLFIIFFHNE